MYYRKEGADPVFIVGIFAFILFLGLTSFVAWSLTWKILLVAIVASSLYSHFADKSHKKQTEQETLFYTYIKQKQKEGKITSKEAWYYLHNKQDEEQIRKELDVV